MKKTSLLLLLGISTAHLFGQSFDSLDANNIKATFTAGNTFFTPDSIGNLGAQYHVPKDSLTSSVYSSGLWVSGLDPANNLKGAGSKYGRQMYWGPVATSYGAAYDSMYRRVWKVTLPEILYHMAHYTDAGYTVPPHIAQWPGNGNTANGEPAILAPFIDQNSNGIYEPALGDYPDICGDQAIFMMYNDGAPGAAGLTCSPMGIEIHVLAYAIASGTDSALNNTTFYNIKVINRSTDIYHDVLFSNYVDPDLGCSENDRVGCDTATSSMFVYNSININNPDNGNSCLTGQYGFGNQKVAQGFTFLNRKLTSFMSYDNGGGFAFSSPDNCAQMRNAQTGHWSDGIPVTYGGIGYQSSTDTIPFTFPGDPLDTAQWSEVNPHAAPPIPAGDRRCAGTVSGSPLLLPGQSFTVDMAYITSFSSSTVPFDYDELIHLRHDIASIRSRYSLGTACAGALINGIPDVTADLIAVYPNPAKDMITVKVDAALIKTTYTLTDMTGRLITSGKIENTSTAISLSGISSGVYLLQAGGRSHKVVKE